MLKDRNSIVMLISMMLCFCLPHAYAQESNLPSRCHIFLSKLAGVASFWDWTSSQEVIFGVTIVKPPDGVSPHQIYWYAYKPATNQLKELTKNPYTENPLRTTGQTSLQTSLLSDEIKGANGLYENVIFAPDKNQFIYPRSQNGRSTLWFVNQAKNISIDLGISFSLDRPPTFWSADGNSFALQDYRTISLVQLQGQKAITRSLTDIPPLTDAGEGFRNLYHRLVSITPDGTKVLFQPDISPPQTWMLDIKSNTLEMWSFPIYADKVVWLDKYSFKAFGEDGIFQYDVNTRETKLLIPRNQIVDEVNSFSPDGKFMLGWMNDPNGTSLKLVVCSVES
jgi:Tol biopolymer transport system component